MLKDLLRSKFNNLFKSQLSCPKRLLKSSQSSQKPKILRSKNSSFKEYFSEFRKKWLIEWFNKWSLQYSQKQRKDEIKSLRKRGKRKFWVLKFLQLESFRRNETWLSRKNILRVKQELSQWKLIKSLLERKELWKLWSHQNLKKSKRSLFKSTDRIYWMNSTMSY